MKNNEKKKKDPGIIETVRNIKNNEELKNQERMEKQNDAQREKYGKQIAEEKIEVLKMKQGVIDQSDAIGLDTDARVYTKKEKFKNFIYHNKWWMGLAIFILLIIAFLVYDTLTTVKPDVRVMLLSDNNNLQISQEALSDYFSSYVKDFNDDGKKQADIVSIPISYDEEKNMSSHFGYGSNLDNLATQFQLGETMIILADSAADEYIEPENFLENLEIYFPDSPYVEGYKFYLKNTDFSNILGLKNDDIPDDLYIAVRKVTENLSTEKSNKKNHDNAIETLRAIEHDLNKN